MADEADIPDYTIELGNRARTAIETLGRESEDGNETGGILLGFGPDEDGIVHVVLAGDAGPRAQRRPGFFLRDLEHARAIAQRAWDESRAIWIGEWHTHPMGGNTPSPVDLGTYVRLLGASALEFEVFVSIIVTPDPQHGWAEPKLWPWLLQVGELARDKPSAPEADDLGWEAH